MRISHWLTRLQNRPLRRTRRAKSQQATESLESRTLLTTVGVPLSPTELSIFVDDGDSVTVQRNSTTGNVEVLDAAMQPVAAIPTFQASTLTALNIFAGDADNTIDVSPLTSVEFPALTTIVIDSGDGDDVITGSDDFAELIDADDGNDTITGNGGDDTIDAGDGNDMVTGGAGVDSILGGDGQDTIDGGDGNDNIDAGDGQDSVDGGDGDDMINAGDGLDTVNGGAGDDNINGMSGTDLLNGDADNDTILGGSENDTVNGGDGNDIVNGQAGNDTVNGDAGDDTGYGGGGRDVLFGGDGDDIVNGQSGNDTLNGEAGMDRGYGGSGNDSLEGGSGNDTLRGHSGNDTILGGAGADLLSGGSGDDLIGTPTTITIDDVTVTEGSTSEVFFTTDFDSGVPVEFSGYTNTESVQGYSGIGNGANQFAGNFLRNDSGGDPRNGGAVPQTPTVLTLTNLPAHTSIDVNFLLAMIGSWNGVTDSQGPDFFNVVVDGVSVFNENFRNFLAFPGSQGYATPPGTLLTPSLADLFAAPSNPADNNDTAYNMSLEPAFGGIAHTSSTLTIEWFADGLFEGQDNESWAIDNVEVVLNGLSQTVMNFTVSVEGAGSEPVTVDVSTADGSATGADYTLITPSVTFAPGEKEKVVSVFVNGDLDFEGDEFFFVNLSNASLNAIITDSQGLGVIIDDDMQALDIFILSDATGSFEPLFGGLQTQFANVVTRVQAALPAADLAFGVGRFQDYANPANVAAIGGARPFILNQPILSVDDPQFDAALDAALLRGLPFLNTGVPDALSESWMEALFQIASGVGLDGNTNGSSLDNGVAGLATNQTTVSPNGDIPAFGTFLPDDTGDPNGPVRAPSGNEGGIGFRRNVRKRLVLLATDAGTKANPDGIDPYVGVNGVTVPAADLFSGSSFANFPSTATTAQATIDALVNENVEVIGLGAAGLFTNVARTPLEAISTLTGAVNNGGMTIDVGNPAGPIAPGAPLYFEIDLTSPTAIADAVVAAITSSIVTQTVPMPPPFTDSGDTIDGGAGNDSLFGGNGDDVINGGSGNDSIGGGAGNDSIQGGDGNDTIDGGSGDDSIAGQSGNDVVTTGCGIDTVLWNGIGNGDDIILASDGAETLIVQGDSGVNNFTVDSNGGLLTVTEGAASITVATSTTTVNVNGGSEADVITIGELVDVNPLVLNIDGQADNDTITAADANIGDVRMFLNGGTGNDTITGSRDGDSINGDGGDDSVLGGLGDDTVDGGEGNDILNGEAGNDSLLGNTGNDLMDGGDGDDILSGSLGNDTAIGGLGNDSLFGGFGADVLNGNSGNDLADGGRDNDQVLGGSGDDSLKGGTGDDTVRGQSGSDLIKGGDGNDRILGESGNDVIDAGDGDDNIDGGNGNDIATGGDGNDTLNGMSGADTLLGGNGADNQIGGAGIDSLYGEEGDDSLNGGGSIDQFNGGEGVDVLVSPDPGEVDNNNLAVSASVLEALDLLNGF